jgi:hypothetical protein
MTGKVALVDTEDFLAVLQPRIARKARGMGSVE